MTTPNKSERNKDAIMRVLWTSPLMTNEQIALALALSENAVHRCLMDLLRRGLVVRRSLCGADRYLDRWWLSYAGLVNQQARRFSGKLPPASSQEGVEKLIGRMPVVVYLYDLAISLPSHQGILTAAPVRMTSELFPRSVTFSPDVALGEFLWFYNQPIDAVADCSNRAWFALKWVGPEMQAHHLMREAESIDDWLCRVVDNKEGPPRPTGWVLLCHDRAAAAHAAQVWPGDNVLVVDVDGRVERTMRPADFTRLWRHLVEELDPGQPERLGRRPNGKDPVQQAPHTAFSYWVFRFIAQWGFATRDQLRRKFGERYSKALGELKKLRLVGVSGEIVRLREPAVRVLSDMDGVDYDTVHGRVNRFVDLKRGILRNPIHDQALIDVFLKLEAEGLSPAEGSRYAMYLPDNIQIVPDLVFCLDRKDGSTLLVLLELEFSATHPQQVLAKVRAYVDAHWHGVEIASAWVVETETVRRLYAHAGRDLIMMTATRDEFLAGTSRGPNSAWRWNNRVDDIDELAYAVDFDLHA